MVSLRAPLSAFASAALWAYAQAAYLNGELSFGLNDKISPNLRDVPNFHLIGNPDPPEILSNKIVLTTPVFGNQRGAVWADKPLLHSWWTADIDFRATGPERGGGNLQIWYAARGREEVGSSSIYTVGKFDGLALVIDQHSGSAGFIRGFLNDGSTDYKSHHNIDSLAFGHCEYAYRNLGRPSRISIQQSNEKFRVEVDGQLCFESPKIRLPTGYNFGITAASAENPDSFEVFKFIVTTESPTPDAEDPNPSNQQESAAARAQRQAPISPNANQGFSSDPASSSEAQFAHLHNRLQAMMQQVSALNRDITQSQSTAAARASTLEAQMSRLERSAEKLDSLAAIDRKLNEIQADVRQTKAELHRAFEQQVSGLKTVVRDTHHSMVGSLAESAPGIMGYFLVAIGSQALTVVAFLLYKRRKANGPKKYL